MNEMEFPLFFSLFQLPERLKKLIPFKKDREDPLEEALPAGLPDLCLDHTPPQGELVFVAPKHPFRIRMDPKMSITDLLNLHSEKMIDALNSLFQIESGRR